LVARRQNNFSDEKIHILFLEIENQYGRENDILFLLYLWDCDAEALTRSLKLLVRYVIKFE